MFVQNHECDLNNHLNNDSKPFYAAQFNKIDGDKVFCTLTEEEAKECKLPAMKKPNMEVALKDILEYSASAEEGIADMVEID